MREIKIKCFYKNKESGEILSIVFDWDSFSRNNVPSQQLFEMLGRSEYTGLKDKNGVEIYEGDIIPIKCGIGITERTVFAVVKFSTEDVASCGCCVPGFSGSGFVAEDNKGYRHELSEYSEVVGNIHENPELLNGDNKTPEIFPGTLDALNNLSIKAKK